MNGLLRDRVTIQRTAAGSLGDESYQNVATNVATRIEPKTRSYPYEFGDAASVDHRAFFSPTVDVRAGDRVIASSGTYLVAFVGRHADHHIEVDLSKVIQSD